MSGAVHLRWPLAVDPVTGALQTVVANSVEEVEQSVKMLLSTRPYERADVPDYGTPDPTGGFDAAAALQAIARFESRAEVEFTTTRRGMSEFIQVATTVVAGDGPLQDGDT